MSDLSLVWTNDNKLVATASGKRVVFSIKLTQTVAKIKDEHGQQLADVFVLQCIEKYGQTLQ